MPAVKLYYFPGACSLAPHILLHEAGISFDLKYEETKALSPELLELNPKARLPVLTMDNGVTTENIAVMTAISNAAPSKQLMGEYGTLDNVRVLEWLGWLSTSLHAAGFGIYYRPNRFTTSSIPDVHNEIKQGAEVLIKDCFQKIESKLGGGFAVGDTFTAVDAYLLVFYRWGMRFWDMKEYPKYTVLMGVVSQREATVKALKEEGL